MITAVRDLKIEEYKRLAHTTPHVDHDGSDESIIRELERNEWKVIEVRVDSLAYVVVHGFPGDAEVGFALPADIAYGSVIEEDDVRLIDIDHQYTPSCCFQDPACKCDQVYDVPDDIHPYECIWLNCEVCIASLHPVQRWYLSRLSTPSPFLFEVDD